MMSISGQRRNSVDLCLSSISRLLSNRLLGGRQKTLIYPAPTVAAIRGVAVLGEDAKTAALTLLFSAYPRNTNVGEVLAKTARLNALYSTNIFGLVAGAEHIIVAQIDPLLADESPEAITSLKKRTFGTKSRRTYSFATKY